MNRRHALVTAMILIPTTFQAICVADDWIQTAAAARIWPVAEGGNGHAYQAVAVSEVIPWSSADRAATLAMGGGCGYESMHRCR